MTSATERWIARACIALIVGMLACGDDDAPGVPRLLYDDFEERCGDLPCGWTRLEGDEGQAVYVETIHPGEHGVRLSGSGVTIRGPGGMPRTSALTFGSLQMELTAICDPDSTLDLKLAVTEVLEGGGSPRTDTLEGRVTPPSEWTGPILATLTATSALSDGGFSGSTFGAPIRVTGVTIAKTGPGECYVDRLVVDDVGTTATSSPGSCE